MIWNASKKPTLTLKFTFMLLQSLWKSTSYNISSQRNTIEQVENHVSSADWRLTKPDFLSKSVRKLTHYHLSLVPFALYYTSLLYYNLDYQNWHRECYFHSYWFPKGSTRDFQKARTPLVKLFGNSWIQLTDYLREEGYGSRRMKNECSLTKFMRFKSSQIYW